MIYAKDLVAIAFTWIGNVVIGRTSSLSDKVQDDFYNPVGYREIPTTATGDAMDVNVWRSLAHDAFLRRRLRMGVAGLVPIILIPLLIGAIFLRTGSEATFKKIDEKRKEMIAEAEKEKRAKIETEWAAKVEVYVPKWKAGLSESDIGVCKQFTRQALQSDPPKEPEEDSTYRYICLGEAL